MACMRTIWTTVLSAAIAMSLPALASGQTDVRALQDALHGNQMGLRSYSADPVAEYKWVDGGLTPGPIVLHGLEAFLTDSVTLKKGKIVLQGNRVTLVRNGTNMAAAGLSPMRLDVDLQGADPTVVIPQLQTALFFTHLQDAIAGLPNLVSHMLPAPVEKNQQTESPTCDCYHIFKDGNWIEIAKSVSKYTNPVILATADPTYSKDASDAKISGTVSLVIHVSEKGRVDEVWLLRPLGFGLDENAANAVRQYVFRPAQLDGKPVEAELTVGVNFQIY
jgi:TonB family protein